MNGRLIRRLLRVRAPWLITLFGCTSTGLTGSSEVSGETHFLTPCDEDAACDSELSCVCGVCTRSCQAPGECTELAPTATCVARSAHHECGSAAPPGVCTLACDTNVQCAERLPGSRCSDGTCTLSATSTAPADAATAGAADAGAQADAYVIPAECVYADGHHGQGSVPSTTAQCENAPMACAPPADEGGCLSTPLTRALAARIGDCGTYCGELDVGTVGGCVTAVDGMVGTVAPVTSEQGLACVRAALLNSRWECARADGWMRFYIGSCTIP